MTKENTGAVSTANALKMAIILGYGHFAYFLGIAVGYLIWG